MSKEVPLSVILYDIKKRGLTPKQACDKHGLHFEMIAPVYRDYFAVIYQKKV